MLVLQLEDNLLQRVTSLVQDSETEFWRSGRFLIRTNRQLVSHKDGMVSDINFYEAIISLFWFQLFGFSSNLCLLRH